MLIRESPTRALSGLSGEQASRLRETITWFALTQRSSPFAAINLFRTRFDPRVRGDGVNSDSSRSDIHEILEWFEAGKFVCFAGSERPRASTAATAGTGCSATSGFPIRVGCPTSTTSIIGVSVCLRKSASVLRHAEFCRGGHGFPNEPESRSESNGCDSSLRQQDKSASHSWLCGQLRHCSGRPGKSLRNLLQHWPGRNRDRFGTERGSQILVAARWSR